MFLTGSFVISSVIGLVCHRRLRFVSASLTPASRRQDHTTSPSALALFVSSTIGVHRIPPRVRDDRDTPLWWDETARTTAVICVARKLKYFSKWGWTGKSPDLRFAQSSLRRRRNLSPLATCDLRRRDHRLGPALDSQLLQDSRYVRLDRRFRNPKLVGYLLVEQAFG